MAIDTRDKRASVLGFVLAFRLIGPNPSGSIGSAAAREQVAYSYSGIVPTPPIPPAPPIILARIPYSPPQAPKEYDPMWMRTQFANVSRSLAPHASRLMKGSGILSATDNKVFFDATAGPISFTLLPPNQVCFQEVHFQKTDVSANVVTLVGTVSGVTDPTLATQYQGKTLYSNGTEWLLVATV